MLNRRQSLSQPGIEQVLQVPFPTLIQKTSYTLNQTPKPKYALQSETYPYKIMESMALHARILHLRTLLRNYRRMSQV